MTPIWGLTEAGVKRTGRDPHARPPRRRRDLRPGTDADVAGRLERDERPQRDRARLRGPLRERRQSGAVVDGRRRHPGCRACPAAAPEGCVRDLEARSDALYAAWLCVRCSATSPCGPAPQALATPWAAASACRTPRCTRWCCRNALAYNAGAAAEAMARVARAVANAGIVRPRAHLRAIANLARDHGAPTALREIGMPRRLPRSALRRPGGAEREPSNRGRSSAAGAHPRAAAATRLRGCALADPIDLAQHRGDPAMTLTRAEPSSRRSAPLARVHRGAGARVRRGQRQDRLRLAADRPAGAVRRGGQVGHRSDEDRVQGRPDDRRQEVRGAGNPEGQPVQSEPRRRGGERPDPQGQGRAGADGRHAGDCQPGERCLRTQRGALHLQRGAVAAVVLRTQGRSGQGLRLDVPHLLGAGRRHRQLHRRLEDGAHEQEGRRPVPQRRRRQCLGRPEPRLSEAAREHGLCAHRPRPVPERHAGLQRADRRLQA